MYSSIDFLSSINSVNWINWMNSDYMQQILCNWLFSFHGYTVAKNYRRLYTNVIYSHFIAASNLKLTRWLMEQSTRRDTFPIPFKFEGIRLWWQIFFWLWTKRTFVWFVNQKEKCPFDRILFKSHDSERRQSLGQFWGSFPSLKPPSFMKLPRVFSWIENPGGLTSENCLCVCVCI